MNDYVVEDNSAFIILRNKYGEEVGRAIIDLDDLALCKQYNWYLDSLGYARTTICGKKVRLHKLLTASDKTILINHINRQKLDCRKCNLREGTYSLNALNKGIQSNNTSSVVGVTYHTTYKPTNAGYWYARYRNSDLGVDLSKPFKTKAKAIEQRNLWVKEYGGIMNE